MKKLIVFCSLFLALCVAGNVFAEEVPFEVVKTKVVVEDFDDNHGNAYGDGIVYEGELNSAAAVGLGHEEDQMDTRVHIPVLGLRYKLEFWNVGRMGGEKGFVFKSNYEKAKLTITYETGEAYKMVRRSDNALFVERVSASTPSFKDTYEYDVEFSGGPYGKFYFKDEKGLAHLLGHVEAGEYIYLNELPERKFAFYPDHVLFKIENSSAFEKWMELMNKLTCQDPSDPTTDSGIRFNNYGGEVYIRACNEEDEETEAFAELGMVLHRSDLVRTGDDSFASLGLPDMTTFKMGPNSKVILSYVPNKRNLFKVVAGKIWANVKHTAKYGTMEVEMSEAVAGIKGTTFVLEDNGNGSTLKVIDGEVEFKSKKTGETKMVKTGESLTATKDGLKEKVAFNIEEENKTFETFEKNAKENTKKVEDKVSEKSGKAKPQKESNSLLWVFVLIGVFFGAGFFFLKFRNNKKGVE